MVAMPRPNFIQPTRNKRGAISTVGGRAADYYVGADASRRVVMQKGKERELITLIPV